MGPAAHQTVLWVLAILLAVIATTCVLRLDQSVPGRGTALAQEAASSGAGRLGARGIYAFPGQVSRTSYGVFMLDVDTGTIWCYELSGASESARQLRLVAARSWVFDRYLEEFNVSDPTPAAVAELIDKQMAQRQRGLAGTAPGAATTRPAGEPALRKDSDK